MDDTDLQVTRRRLDELYDHNLIAEPARGRYRLHDLLREYARPRAAADAADNQAAIGRLLDYYLHTAVAASQHIAWRTFIAGSPLPGPAPAWAPELRTEEEAIAWLRTERANLHACTGYAATHEGLAHAVRIPTAVSDFLLAEGHWNEAASLGQAALAAARTAGDRRGQACVLNQLGTVQDLTGDYPAATASQTQALQLSRDLGDRRGQAWALNQLGTVQRLTGEYPAAAASLTQALQLSRDLGDRRGQAWALNQLGTRLVPGEIGAVDQAAMEPTPGCPRSARRKRARARALPPVRDRARFGCRRNCRASRSSAWSTATSAPLDAGEEHARVPGSSSSGAAPDGTPSTTTNSPTRSRSAGSGNDTAAGPSPPAATCWSPDRPPPTPQTRRSLSPSWTPSSRSWASTPPSCARTGSWTRPSTPPVPSTSCASSASRPNPLWATSRQPIPNAAPNESG